MRWRYTLYVVGAILTSVSLTMLIALAFSLYYGDGGVVPLLKSMGVSLGLGLGLFFVFRKSGALSMNHREGMAIVALGWAAAGIVGAFDDKKVIDVLGLPEKHEPLLVMPVGNRA